MILRFSTVWLVLFLAGCAAATWSRVEQPQISSPARAFTIEAPVGWMHATFPKDRILLTRDGPDIQFVRVFKTSHEEAFPTMKKTSRPEMLPSELAELVVAELKANTTGIGMEIMENAPLEIAGHRGFRLHLRFHTEEGLRYQVLFCGFASQEGFYALLYQAPTLHYFQRDLPEFEKMVRTFRLGGA